MSTPPAVTIQVGGAGTLGICATKALVCAPSGQSIKCK
jgi:hypothetical protein